MQSKVVLYFGLLIAIQMYVSKGAEDEVESTTEQPVRGKLTYKSYPDERERNVESEKNTFKKFVLRRHAERLKAVSNVLNLKYAKQYEMLETVFPTLFEVLLSSRIIVETAGYIPGNEWPLNMTVRDAMAQIVENTLYFGEVVLRLPDVTHRIMKKHKEWQQLIEWSWFYSQECLPYLHEKLHKPLNLMAQELGFITKDPEFYNQFRLEDKIPESKDTPSEKVRENKKRKSKGKGPKMTSASTGEL